MLAEHLHRFARRLLTRPAALEPAVDRILGQMTTEVAALYADGAERKSDFFRDLAGSRYLALAESEARETGVGFDVLAGLFDKAILDVENSGDAAGHFEAHAAAARAGMSTADARLAAAIDEAARVSLEQAGSVGTGYGRAAAARSRRSRSAPRSSATASARTRCFPRTRTVLDIGGQDTKAIQVDEHGIVTSFQMNDRCAAGCGRYLGYIADEMSLGLHELGPLAGKSKSPVRINSTCTVFAGAELRERLSLGEKREDILAGPPPRDHPARDVAARALRRRPRTSSPSPAASRAIPPRLARLRKLRQRELRRR